MGHKIVNQFNNYGTIHQFSNGEHSTLIYNGTESVAGDKPVTSPADDDALLPLAVYVRDAGRRAIVVDGLRQALSARDIAFKVVATLDDLPTIDRYVVVKEKFIQTLLDVAVNVTQGRSVNNVREQINKMLERHKWPR